MSRRPVCRSVRGHKAQLQEVVVNLVHNAIEAMATTTSRDRLLKLTTQRRGDDAIVVQVLDTGPGIRSGAVGRDIRCVRHHQAAGNRTGARHMPHDHRASRRRADGLVGRPERSAVSIRPAGHGSRRAGRWHGSSCAPSEVIHRRWIARRDRFPPLADTRALGADRSEAWISSGRILAGRPPAA